MRQILFIALLALGAGCAVTKNASAKPGKLNGTWIPLRQEMNGTALPKEAIEHQKLIIADSFYTVIAESVDKGVIRYKGNKMDIYGKDGPNAGKHFTAIYKYDNEELTICYNLAGNSYPETFDTKNKPLFFLSVFTRAAVTQTTIADTTPKVTGIGGIFFKSKSAKATREWYGKNLGLAINPYGSAFEFRNANRPEEINYLEWTPFKESTDYFKPSEKEFMINYRVQNMEGLVRKLKENGVTIVDTIQQVEYGKFVHIMDDDGNKIELWEPVDSVFTKMGGPTTK